MRRMAVALGLCVTMASLCCVGCGGIGASPAGTSADAETGKLVLTVTSSSWSGWDGGSVSAPREKTYEVIQGEHYVAEEGPLGLAFTIVDVGNDSVTLEADEEMSLRSEGGGIDLTNPQKQFTVTLGSECGLATPTMDAGATYTLSLSRK